MNSDYFYENTILALFVGVIILAVVLAVNYFRKPTYRNVPVRGVPLTAEYIEALKTKNERVACELKEQTTRAELLERELTVRKTELTTCQAERDNFRGLWGQSVERGKVLNAEITSLESQLDFGNETIKWMKADLERAMQIIKEYELILGIKEPFIPEILSKENIQKAMDKTVAEFIQSI